MARVLECTAMLETEHGRFALSLLIFVGFSWSVVFGLAVLLTP